MRQTLVWLGNLWIFVTEALWRGTPLWLWPRAWRDINEAHLQQVRKDIWELKKQGKVVEKDGRLYPNERKEQR